MEIRYSKLTGIDGLLVVNHDDVETFSTLLSLREGNLLVNGGGFPSQRASNIELCCCFDVCLNMIFSLNNQVAVDFRRHDAYVMSL